MTFSRLLTGGGRTALPRHQTLRALIDWSYELLTKPERVLLRRLSVFAGGWTFEAARSGGWGGSGGGGGPRPPHRPGRQVARDTCRARRRGALPAAGNSAAVCAGTGCWRRAKKRPCATGTGSSSSSLPKWHTPPPVREKERSVRAAGGEHGTNLRAALAWAFEGGGGGGGGVATPAESGSTGSPPSPELPTNHCPLSTAYGWPEPWGQVWFDRGYWNEGRQWLERALGRRARRRADRRAGAGARRRRPIGHLHAD